MSSHDRIFPREIGGKFHSIHQRSRSLSSFPSSWMFRTISARCSFPSSIGSILSLPPSPAHSSPAKQISPLKPIMLDVLHNFSEILIPV